MKKKTIMEKIEEFISYKKMLLFGSYGSGKTSLTKSIEKDVSEDDSQIKDGKNYLNLYQ